MILNVLVIHGIECDESKNLGIMEYNNYNIFQEIHDLILIR